MLFSIIAGEHCIDILVPLADYIARKEGSPMWYKHSLDAIEAMIKKKLPQSLPKNLPPPKGVKASGSYMLWTIERIRAMPTHSAFKSAEAATAVGWLFAHVELYEWWDYRESRRLRTLDIEDGFHDVH